MKVKIKVYNATKYNPDSVKVAEIEYDIEKFEVVELPDEQVYAMGFDEVDEYKEYLILTHKNGETSTFRNSNVDLFRA